MERWPELRAHYRREFLEAKKRGEKQTTVAKRAGFFKPGGQPNNGQISKILNDQDYTPQLDTFLKAVQGLGMTMREFLTRMHQRLEQMPVTGQGLRSPDSTDDLTLLVRRLDGPPIAIGLKQLTEAVQHVVARERPRSAR